MLPPRIMDRFTPAFPRNAVLRCWYVRLVWPASLIVLFVVSLPRVTSLAGMVYLVVIDITGILAGLQGANWVRDAHQRGDTTQADGPVPPRP